MFGIGMPEMILILAVALIVIGPKKLPDLAKSLGKAMREFKNATAEIKDSLNVDDDLNDIKKNLRKTETATPPEKDKAGELKPETGLTSKGIPDPYPESDTENDNGPPNDHRA